MYEHGLSISSESHGSYFLTPELLWDDTAQPHWDSPYDGHPYGHVIKAVFDSEEETEKFYDWLKNTGKFAEELSDGKTLPSECKTIENIEGGALFLHIPEISDICSAVLRAADVGVDNIVTLRLFLSVEGGGWDEVREFLENR